LLDYRFTTIEDRLGLREEKIKNNDHVCVRRKKKIVDFKHINFKGTECWIEKASGQSRKLFFKIAT
jgi:hypothetical protein